MKNAIARRTRRAIPSARCAIAKNEYFSLIVEDEKCDRGEVVRSQSVTQLSY